MAKALWLITMTLATTSIAAKGSNAEIEFLLSAISSSGCLFLRNNTEYSAIKAESHLRMKYRNAVRYVSSAEDFITRIASKSSWTGKAYQIQCPDKESQTSAQWLSDQLSHYRAGASD
jgi:hypothetical protein